MRSVESVAMILICATAHPSSDGPVALFHLQHLISTTFSIQNWQRCKLHRRRDLAKQLAIRDHYEHSRGRERGREGHRNEPRSPSMAIARNLNIEYDAGLASP